jgi:transposase
MAQNFVGCGRDQELLLPPSLREWLPGNHLAWFVIDAVEAMDLAAFYAVYRHDGHGRPAHEPSMMVTLLMYCYAIGERSSRRIERRCVEDIAVRVICANQAPDHTTISRFCQRHEGALADLFGEVLGLCVQAGLVGIEVLAIDGTKVHANASQHANVDYEQLAKKILEEAAEIDAAEDEQFGDRRGDERPPSWRPRRAGAVGCAKPSAASTISALGRRGRSRPPARRGCRRPSAAWTRSCGPSARPTRPTRPTAPGAA